MLLNQLWSENGNIKNLLSNSFFQLQANRAITDIQNQVKPLKEVREVMVKAYQKVSS
ncbi:hypothetical protein IGI04_031012 [Brassica rapa subsp. trilocularis]|uniref:Uncharacterized protein n=1 Tax=Brassica rapa subsp. trilocularis TaxID=1813537 RepID=A0ABQ7LUS0_BRACM|nr:hypothetical protein IGI04_031012 [Brassica rapa subsp. trilocularis]